MALGPGSIAFVGFNADGNDNLAFVALQDIAAGEAITFEDNEWNGSTWSDANENAFIWTATSAVAAGTIVTLNNVGVTTPAPSASTGTVVFGASATYGSNHGLGNSTETIYAYSGTRAAPTFITAVSNNGTDPTSGSLLNTGLTYGVNALDLGLRDSDGDIFAWKGARSGYSDFAAARAALNATPNAANWDAQDASGDQSADGTAPDLPFSTAAFTISDTTAPTLNGSAPADNATGVAASANIVLTFSEAVKAGSGNLVITAGGDTRTIAVTDATQVTIVGNTVTINPTADLLAGTAYHVEIAAGAITDLSGNAYAGIADASTLNFATTSGESQQISFAANSLWISQNEGNTGTTDFTFTVQRTGGTTGDVNFSVTLAPGTTDAADYAGGAVPTTVSGTIPSGQTSATVTIHAAGDVTPESNESFSLALDSALTNSSPGVTVALAGNNTTATGTILDDDSFTHIYTIQGAGHTSALNNQIVTTRGVVTAVDSNGGDGSRGFYVQDVTGDGNAAISDGIFVFQSSGVLPTVGHLVQVTGRVAEFTPSGAAAGSFSTTELTSVTSVVDLGVGPTITPVQIGGVGGLQVPTSDLVAGALFYESLENMLVTVKAPTAVGPTNNFGEIFAVVDNDNDASNGIGGATGLTPRGNLLLTPGEVAFGDNDTTGGDYNPERIQIDADSGMLPGFTKPSVNVGAHLSDVTGIVAYAFANYEVLATQPYTVTQPSTLVKETGTFTGDSNHLVIASYNAENLDPKVEDINKVSGTTTAQKQSNIDDDVGLGKFDTIANQIFNTLHAPDILALQEIQDEDGAELSSDTSAAGTLQLLVDKINALSAAAGSTAHYAYVDNPFLNNNAQGTANGGQPGGNIRTAYLYRDDRVSLVANSLKTIAADGTPISDPAGNTDQLNNPDNPFFQSRPPLIATFHFNGQDVTVIDGHFTSKGGSAPLLGSDQPPLDAGEVTRAAQAQAVNNFIDSILAADPNAKIVVAGDLNEFQFEEPLNVLKGTATISNYDVPGSDPITATATYIPGGTAVLTDLQDQLPANERYDYVFEGNSETLDHLLVSNNLAASTQFDIVHLNAEFADQTSDHEPLTALVYLAPVVSGQESYTLAAGGTLTAPTGPAVIWNLAPPTTGSNATVDNAGAISATSGRAIDTSGTSNGNNHFTLNNQAGASIMSPDDAIRINADLPNGVVTIDNFGTIRSTTSGQAIDFNNIVAASVSTTITNQATGVITAANADAVRPGTNTVINNHGQIAATGTGNSDGVDFQDVGFGTVHNFTGGTIVGVRHGITGKLPIEVDNDQGASITGQLGSGINLDTQGTTTTIVNNSGTITGHAAGSSDGDGIDVDGLATIDNHGLIEGLGTWSGGLSEAITIGGGTINNYTGGVIHSVQRAITVDDSNLGNALGATTIYNEGTITGDNGEAIAITDTFADVLTNKGAINGSVSLGAGNDTVNVYTGATFSATVDGGDGIDAVDLFGTGQGNLSNLANIEVVNLHGGDWTLGREGFTSVNLASGNQTLRLASNTLVDGQYTGVIAGFGNGDVIDLKGIGTAAHATLGVGNVLTITGGPNGPVSLQLDPAQDYSNLQFKVAADGGVGAEAGTLLTTYTPYTLQLLHMADAEGSALSVSTAPIMGALIDKFDNEYVNTVVLAGGDSYLPGPFMTAGADPSLNAIIGSTALGRPDIAILNAFGVDASALGNHEFDLGSPVLQGAIAASSPWVGAQFPFITANLSFAGDSALRGLADKSVGGTATNDFAGKEASSIKGKIAPSAIVTQGGEKIGIVGLTSQLLLTVTSPNGTTVKDPFGDGNVINYQELAAILQPVIDSLLAQGVNKVIMVDQLDAEVRNEALAPLLHGVDIMAAGGGHERLGDANDTAAALPGHDPNFTKNYPIVLRDADNNPTLLVTTDSEHTYLGRLVVQFDDDGHIILDQADNVILGGVADASVINGAYASTPESLQAAYGTSNIQDVINADPNGIAAKVNAITSAIGSVIAAKDGNLFGYTDVYLEGDRVFGRTQETNLGDVSADANTHVAREALGSDAFIVSLKNGGGIRASIGSIDDDTFAKVRPDANPLANKPEGAISQLDVENALRFDNKLMVFDTTPQQLLNILNFAGDLTTLGAAGVQQGGFPQVGGLRFSFDPDLPAGHRIDNVSLVNEQGELVAKLVEHGVVVAGAPSTISVVILNFTANGGDGYPIKANGDNFRFLLDDGSLSGPINESLDFTAASVVPANAMGEQKAFESFLQDEHGTPQTAIDLADTPASQDLRIENLNVRTDAVFQDAAPVIAGDLAITVDENHSVVITTADLTEADPDNSGAQLTYTVTGTNHGQVLVNAVAATSFTQVQLAAGQVAFQHDGSNVSTAGFTVTLADPAGLSSGAATVVASVTPVNDAPVISSSDNFSVAENQTQAGIVVAADPDHDAFVFAKAGGADQAFFSIDPHSGVLSFIEARDFETPEDANHDNVYDVVVSAQDVFGASSTQTIHVSVTDVAEAGRTVNGGNGNDNLAGSTGGDTIDGGNGNDVVNAGDGDDSVVGGNGNDVLNGGRGNDVLAGGNGDDTLDGGSGDNQLAGGNGNDLLRAANGNNALDGGAGNDRLIVGTGNNTLTGGGGSDNFVFGPGFGNNVVTDFQQGDHVEFNGGVFANFASVQAAMHQVGADTVISLGTDHTITLDHVLASSLHANDFLLS